MKITQRLARVAALLRHYPAFADIGTDHGYLPCYMLTNYPAMTCIATDVNRGPLAAAQIHLAQEIADSERYELRLGDGLVPLMPDEVPCITMMGMGGRLMVDILQASPQVVDRLTCIIAQPNVAAHLLRQWCNDRHWHVAAEEILWEDGYFYEILVLCPGIRQPLTAVEIAFGPHLLHDKTTVMNDYLTHLWQKDVAIVRQWQKASQRMDDKLAHILQKWQTLNEVRRCQFPLEQLSHI